MRIDILFVVTAFASALPGASGAQDTGAARACATIEADHDRLACYDRALRIAPSTAEPAAAAVTAVPAAAASGATSAAQTAVETKPTSVITTAPRTNVRNASAGAAPAPLQPGTPATVAPSQDQALGIVPIIVLSTRTRPGHGTEFTTDQGKVWVQRDTQPLVLPPTPFNAQLTPGALGGFFLVPENRSGIRVRQHE